MKLGGEIIKLYINTLGDFDLKIENESILKESSRSYRLYKLFQYFITFRNKKLLPDTIIDNLWDNHESQDPKNMLRAQIFRLRQMIKNILPEELDESKYLNISFNNGYYSLEIGELTTIDIDEFEALILIGDTKRQYNINQAIEAYSKALNLYKGTYLEENAYEVWLVPVRNYYRRLYLKTLFKLIEIFKEKEEYSIIVELCEKGIAIEPYEESIHIYLMEAMLKLGQIKNAISYYNYISAILEKQMGTKSSPAMRDINRKIQNYFIDKGETDIFTIKKKLEEGTNDRSLLCDFDYFKFLYNIQERKRAKKDEPDFISLITLSCDNCKQEEINNWMKIMTEALEGTLRKGDAFTFWNDTQILIIFDDAKEDGLESIESRIRKTIKRITKDTEYIMSIKFIPIVPDNNFTIKSPI
ncbi:bacterial transcriptional activator domain-containing protein [Clostridium sp. Cult2]|uniref:bacterial transcriptional activator domain-containing protein n=1 Tax=Clostridium sp. Cult2 TaxID=2079003 RepID=UPI001F1EEC90|nr:bacterial transcriptional activator domain-containing protein [Clostridium sp. Cult2]